MDENCLSKAKAAGKTNVRQMVGLLSIEENHCIISGIGFKTYREGCFTLKQHIENRQCQHQNKNILFLIFAQHNDSQENRDGIREWIRGHSPMPDTGNPLFEDKDIFFRAIPSTKSKILIKISVDPPEQAAPTRTSSCQLCFAFIILYYIVHHISSLHSYP